MCNLGSKCVDPLAVSRHVRASSAEQESAREPRIDIETGQLRKEKQEQHKRRRPHEQLDMLLHGKMPVENLDIGSPSLAGSSDHCRHAHSSISVGRVLCDKQSVFQ